MFGQTRLVPFRYVIALLGALGLVQLVWAVADDWDFPRILRMAEQRYGSLGEGRQRLLAWQQLRGAQVSAAEVHQLRALHRLLTSGSGGRPTIGRPRSKPCASGVATVKTLQSPST